jgi:AcrR family transcriptional regulator
MNGGDPGRARIPTTFYHGLMYVEWDKGSEKMMNAEGKSTRQAVDMRQQILETAKGLFIQQGYHGLAMREIAEALGVTKAALYYHFKDKEELFLAILSAYLDEMEVLLAQIQAEPLSSSGRVRMLVTCILTQPTEQRALIRLASQEMAQVDVAARQAFDRAYHEKFIDRIKALLAQGMESAEFRRMDLNVATWILLGMMYPYFYPAHGGEGTVAGDVIEAVVGVYLQGIEERT